MVKSFNVYLKNRVQQCDLIVTSLSYHQILSIRDVLILQSCVKAYALQKFLAEQNSDLELVAHIENMIETCSTLINSAVGITATADLKSSKSFSISEDMVVNSDLKDLCYTIVTKVDNTINISSKVLGLDPRLSFGRASNKIEINSKLNGFDKQSFFEVKNEMDILSELLGVLEEKYISCVSSAQIETSMDVVMRYQRALGEMDENALSLYDDMTIEQIDFTIS